jgi:glycine hydroxymethyltransferase
VDVVEQLAIDRLKQLYGANFANVQPNSGSQANQGVFFGLLNPGDTIMGMSLAEGGHLTHGMPLNMSGKWFKVVSYGLDANEVIDYDAMERLAHEHRPKLIIAGASAYSLRIDFERFSRVAKAIGAIFLVDMAHYAGLIAAGVYPNPLPHADVVTSTTHKSLRGPRGGIILTNDEAIAKKMNSAIFPGIQGGPLMHVIAGKAVAFREALQPEFKVYQQQVLDNARVLAETLIERGLRIVSGRTESHVMLVDLRPKGLTGKEAEAVLGQAHMTCNKNGIPNDPQKPMVTSGIRLGTPAMTTRGFKEVQARQTGHLIADVLDKPHDEANIAAVRQKVSALTGAFPVYG